MNRPRICAWRGVVAGFVGFHDLVEVAGEPEVLLALEIINLV